MNMTINLEGVRAVLVEQLERELDATVTGSIQSHRERQDIVEVTFDLWIERTGTKIHRTLYVVLRMSCWDVAEFRKFVRMFCDKKIKRDLMKQQSRDFLAKAEMN